EVVEAGVTHMVVGVRSTEALSALTLDLAGLTRLGQEVGFVGTVLYAPAAADPGEDPDERALPGAGAPGPQGSGAQDPAGSGAQTPAGRVRMFAPGTGIVEDPATGSAVAPLVLWLQR